MILGAPAHDRRARRHEASRQEILDAAWGLAREEGLAGFSLGEVAARVGMRAPSIYSYFKSKNEIYDAMFAQGSEELLETIQEALPRLPRRGRDRLRAALRTYFDFCTSDPLRYELLFQRTVPGFVPSEASYAKAREVLGHFEKLLAEVGLSSEQAEKDLLTALSTGLVAQQLANDPGGDRWARLVDEAADMAYDHYVKRRRRRR